MARLMFSAMLIILPATICAGASTQARKYSRTDKLSIRSVRPDRTELAVYDRLTLDVALAATFDNPFDQEDIAVDAHVSAPDGRWTVPAFFYAPYSRDDNATRTRRTVPAGPPRWQVRLSFPKPGKYGITVTARDRSGSETARPVQVVVTPADASGVVRRAASDHRYFITDSGRTYFPVGANVCWGEGWGGGGRNIFAYDEWFPKYAANRCNFARLWLSLEWNDLATITAKSGYDEIDLQRAWHLDHVFDLAEKHNIRLMLCFDAHGMLRNKKRLHGFWEDSPLHPDHGAPINKPVEFFTNKKMLAAYRNRLRYLVARYGYSTSLFAWEFFNEVDLIDDYDSKLVSDWHREMAGYLRGIDPWKHLITTSYANPKGDPAVDSLPELDFVQSHHYEARDIAAAIARDIADKPAAKNRPHLQGEFGINHSGAKTGEIDPTGIHIHNALYSCVGQLHAGTPMSWWWDSYINPRNLYPLYGAFNRWIDGFDFVAQQPVKITARFADPGANLRVYGLMGKTRALIWVQNPHHTWSNVAEPDYAARPSKPTTLIIKNIAPGRWTLESFDTHAGRPTASAVVTVSDDRTLTIDLPAITWDAAFRIFR
jgi:hypothetical protein